MGIVPKSKRGRKRYVLLSIRKDADKAIRTLCTKVTRQTLRDAKVHVIDQTPETGIIGCDHRALPLLLVCCAEMPGISVRRVSGTLRGLRNL
jgi:RNase P/RNase MRP subunit POP5